MKRIFIFLIFFVFLAKNLNAIISYPYEQGFESYNIGDNYPSNESIDIYEISDYTSGIYSHRGFGYAVGCHAIVDNTYTAREGSKYHHMYCTVPEGDCTDLLDIHKWVWSGLWVSDQFNGTHSAGTGMEYNDDYWFGFSIYIPTDYYAEIGHHMIFAAKEIPGACGQGSWKMYSFDKGDDFYFRYSGVEGAINTDIPVSWQALRGTWVDIVIHTVPSYYAIRNADSILEIWINGAHYGLRGANEANIKTITQTEVDLYPTCDDTTPDVVPAFSWALYNTYANLDAMFPSADPGPASDYPENYWEQCDEAIVGSPTPEFTRELNLDSIRFMHDSTPGTDYYCTVAPTIWSSAPTITNPTQNETDISTTETVTYGAYADHRTDAQTCFARTSTTVQIDEQGGNWSSLVYENTAAGATSQAVSGLSEDTYYQLRVMHKSLRSGTVETYDGEWSTTINFLTGSPPIPVPTGRMTTDGQGGFGTGHGRLQ